MIASGRHRLFTELDHAFVNSLTDQFRDLLPANFPIEEWDAGSGYQTDSMATFNEYMTWCCLKGSLAAFCNFGNKLDTLHTIY